MNLVQDMIKRSKFLLNAGKPQEAKLEAEHALTIAARNRQFAQYLPIAEHRLAMVLKTLKQYKSAREHFEHALATFDRSDRIGYAILLRDYGFFLANELRNEADYSERGLEKLKEAERLLEGTFPPSKSERARLELLVTEGFLYRVRLRTNRFDHEALIGLKLIDRDLREVAHNKPGYELDNLGWIIRYEDRVKPVTRYLPRAIALSVRLGNPRRTVEYTVLASGGQIARAGLNRAFNS